MPIFSVTLLRLLLTGTTLIGLPLIGVVLAGNPLDMYIEFPPLTHYVLKPAFSWPLFIFGAVMDFLLLGGVLFLILSSAQTNPKPIPTKTNRFPIWGWAGIAIVALGWLLAWTRMSWFASLQQHTFVLPWIGYILVVNGLCCKRSSRCLMLDDPRGFLLLFPFSAFFWWFFEYLNRFVQNWYYVGIEEFGPARYILFASLSFSTVLPAVLSTYRYLGTFSLFNSGLTGVYAYRTRSPYRLATLSLAVSVPSLSLIGVYPNHMYPVLWISPLLIYTALQVLSGQTTIFHKIETGDWRDIVGPAFAALICGFFWEMWNMGSLAKWQYAIPYVNRFHIFEMPLLGYGGYLPFGLECLVFGRLVTNRV